MSVQPNDIEHRKLQSNHRRADERLKKASLVLDAAKAAKDRGTRRGQAAIRHTAKAHKKAALSEAIHSAALLEYVLPPSSVSPAVRKRL
ncbi:hypothetical protein J2X57_000076 [Luteibacter sp. 1214]|uniref:hypothetical protein n=1 Tax=Luteibacter sp. 1214 TaxID=2817735 RepID=UPI002864EE69|nr:hypothetical protein [Luteibacter sp. 1214]MDR6640882.1 hypothetical protein [Luteibacter sp. 1214]